MYCIHHCLKDIRLLTVIFKWVTFRQTSVILKCVVVELFLVTVHVTASSANVLYSCHTFLLPVICICYIHLCICNAVLCCPVCSCNVFLPNVFRSHLLVNVGNCN